ncbi:MAG TPA: glycosyltransferase family 9 protein, partial [Candidatus Berkiella sp.]|nr:glycosyltransferase family 9 protein [Candidatus Berkiella sp.]
YQQGECSTFIKTLRATQYDLIIDAQGLLKSAMIACLAKGKRVGLHYRSAREKCTSLFYDQRVEVPWQQHAVERVRQLFAGALQYAVPKTPPQYGVDTTRLPTLSYGDDTI